MFMESTTYKVSTSYSYDMFNSIPVVSTSFVSCEHRRLSLTQALFCDTFFMHKEFSIKFWLSCVALISNTFISWSVNFL